MIENGASRSPHGERGLKLFVVSYQRKHDGRSPHGERGLKWVNIRGGAGHGESLSSWRAWIEIGNCRQMD